MRRFASLWPDEEAIGQQPVGQLPWGHIVALMEKLDKPELREWYASQAITNGWSRAVLEHHLKTVAHQRFGAAPTNVDRLLEPGAGASELAQQITKDPYVFDFLAVEPGYVERELEDALVERIIDTLGELGSGFSFVGRQMPLEVDGDGSRQYRILRWRVLENS